VASPAEFAWVALGGGAGAALRFGATALSVKLLGKSFAWGTLAVNLAGCLCIGLVLHAHEMKALWDSARPLLAIGLLGGLTTFSTFGYDTWIHVEAGRWDLAGLNAGANLILGVLLVAAGLWLGRAIWPLP
jgi:CrcB protein